MYHAEGEVYDTEARDRCLDKMRLKIGHVWTKGGKIK